MAKRLTKAQKLAVVLHANLCHANHTDGCTWYYTNDEKRWDNVDRFSPEDTYLKWAEKILAAYDGNYDNALKAVDAVHGPLLKK